MFTSQAASQQQAHSYRPDRPALDRIGAGAEGWIISELRQPIGARTAAEETGAEENSGNAGDKPGQGVSEEAGMIRTIVISALRRVAGRIGYEMRRKPTSRRGGPLPGARCWSNEKAIREHMAAIGLTEEEVARRTWWTVESVRQAIEGKLCYEPGQQHMARALGMDVNVAFPKPYRQVKERRQVVRTEATVK